MVDGHAIAQYARYQFGVVPILGIEFLRKAFDRGLVAALVLKLKVVAVSAVGIGLLDDLAVSDRLGEHDAFLVLLQTGKDLVGITVEETNEVHPFLAVVLKAHHVAVEFLGAHFLYHGTRDLLGLCLLLLLLLLVFLGDADHHARTASVAIDGAAFAAASPCLNVELVDQGLVDVVGKVHGDRDASKRI